MELLYKIIFNTYGLARQQRLWVVLAAGQFFCLLVAGWAINFANGSVISFLLFFLLSVGLAFFTFYLWQNVLKEYTVRILLLGFKPKFNILEYSRGVGVFFLTLVSLFFFQKFFLSWVWFLLFSSIFAVFSVSVLLALKILSFNLVRSIKITWDLWVKLPWIPQAFTFLILLGNTISFILAKKNAAESLVIQVFPNFLPSVIIAVLVCLLFLFIAWFLVFVNTFLVLGFLEIIKNIRSEEPKELFEAKESTDLSI